MTDGDGAAFSHLVRGPGGRQRGGLDDRLRRRAGARTLVARFGYIGPDDRPETWGADGIIDHPHEVLAWV